MNLFDKIPPQPAMIDSLKVGESVDWYYLTAEVEKRKKKDGGDFLVLQLLDRSGRISAKVWDNVPAAMKVLRKGAPARFSGEVVEYNGRKELKVVSVRPTDERDGACQPELFEEPAAFDTAERFSEMMAFLGRQVKSPFLLQLLELFAAEHGPAFRVHYGAQKIHHAYNGGLLEHTDSVVRLAAQVADFYSLDKELLCVGALLHDLGKVYEFGGQPAVEVTLEGGLLGHIVIGLGLFLDMVRRIPDFPPDLSARLQHLLISHHGEREFGSPEIPKTPEGMALNFIDMLDSRLSIYRELKSGAEGGRLFSEYSNVLGTRVLL